MTIDEKHKILNEFEKTKKLVADAERHIADLREKILRDIGSGKHGAFVVLISEQERESFNLKEAKSEATPAFLEKIMAFVKRVTYQTVKVERL